MTIEPPNQNSTCEWVDEAYSRRLWAQLVRRAESIAPGARRSLLAVRKHADEVYRDSSHHWFASLLVPAANGALDLMAVEYDRNGRFKLEVPLLRISQHAGQRLFERLRTNSADDVLATLRDAIWAFTQNKPESQEAELKLPHGSLHVVDDAGLWVAKTFIPAKRE